jgi:hypothetical protein
MTELNRLLRQAARITAGISPNTSRAEEDHKDDASYVTALAGEKKASKKKADADPNTPQAEDDHKGDAAYETALKEAAAKKAEEAPVEFEGSASPEVAGKMFEAADGASCEGEDCGITNADLVEALEDVKQGIEDAKEEMGPNPASELLSAIEDVLSAVGQMQDAVSSDAMLDPEAADTFKTASAFKNYFIRERNIKAAKVIRQKLAEAAAVKKVAAAPTKRAFDPKSVQK